MLVRRAEFWKGGAPKDGNLLFLCFTPKALTLFCSDLPIID